MNSIRWIILLCLLAFVASRGGRRKGAGAGKVGKTMGDGIVTLINDMRSGPEAMPKGYKRDV